MMTTAEGGAGISALAGDDQSGLRPFRRPAVERRVSTARLTPATPAASRSVPSPPPASISTARAMRIKRDNDVLVLYRVSARRRSHHRTGRSPGDAGGRRYHVNRRRPSMLHRLAADLASGLAAAAAPAGGPQGTSTACRLDKSLPMVQLSQRLLLESMGGTTLSPASEAALEAIACLLRPVLHQRDPAPSRREKQFQKIIALIDASIQSEHLRPEWLASETGMSVRSLYRLFADQGWWWRSILRTGGWICVPRRYRMFMTISWRGSATAGASATTAISPPPLSSALASPRGIPQALSLIICAATGRSIPGRTPRAARGPQLRSAIFATSSTGRLLSSASCW